MDCNLILLFGGGGKGANREGKMQKCRNAKMEMEKHKTTVQSAAIWEIKIYSQYSKRFYLIPFIQWIIPLCWYNTKSENLVFKKRQVSSLFLLNKRIYYLISMQYAYCITVRNYSINKRCELLRIMISQMPRFKHCITYFLFLNQNFFVFSIFPFFHFCTFPSRFPSQ